jgi:glucose-1-phosphate cytidylyltransferase
MIFKAKPIGKRMTKTSTIGEKIVPVILCGGQGSRLQELTRGVNKPLIKVGNAPIVFHVAYRFWVAGAKSIYIAAGWRFEHFRKNFLRAKNALLNDPIFGPFLSETEFFVIDTGEQSDTFTRVQRINEITQGSHLLVTYGDTITDVNCIDLIESYRHVNCGKEYCMLSAVQPEKRFSSIVFDPKTKQTLSFAEKEGRENDWVGCGFIMFPKNIVSKLKDFESMEREVLPLLANEGRLFTNLHMGLWHPIDYMNDVELANALFAEAIEKGPPSWLNPNPRNYRSVID